MFEKDFVSGRGDIDNDIYTNDELNDVSSMWQSTIFPIFWPCCLEPRTRGGRPVLAVQ